MLRSFSGVCCSMKFGAGASFWGGGGGGGGGRG